MKVFFSYASEDKVIVEQVFLRVKEGFPNISAWLDKYEIKGGDELIDKISHGIESSDKFFIFLSSSSIEKPWVKAELRKALMKELNGVNPEFIIPIKLGNISVYPAFLESKYYIDLESKTMDEWLADMHIAITREPRQLAPIEENIKASLHIASDNPNAAIILFEARFWAEEINFRVTTKTKIIRHLFRILPELKGKNEYYSKQIKTDYEFAIKLLNHKIELTKQFYMIVEFEKTADPRKEIDTVELWDGKNPGATEFLVKTFK